MAENSTTQRAAFIAALGFPLLVLAGGAVGLMASDLTASFSGWVNPLLGVVMFAMGLTLKPVDFALVVKKPLPVLIGVVAQYVFMPLIAVVLVAVLNLPGEIAAGVILVGCAPGGTSSNVVSYLARGDVALSVTITSVSTMLAPILTPILSLWLAGQYLPVSASSMALSILQVVLVPVVAGLVVRWLLPGIVEKLLPALPWVSVGAIAVIVAVVVGGSSDKIAEAGLIVVVAVIVHNALGYALGYVAGRLTGQSVPARRTMAVEVGMQNSGLAAGLASSYLSPLAALPAAVFSVWHNLSGALLAALCRAVDRRRDQATR